MMRGRFVVAAFCGLGIAALVSRAQEQDLRGIVRKAIEAHGGEKKLEKYKAVTTKFQGKLDTMGLSLEIAGDQSFLHPDKFRVAMAFEVKGKKFDMVQVFDGKSFWISVAGQTQEIKDDKLINEMRENLRLEQAGGLVGLLKKEYELSSIGEVKVKGKPALGVRVSKKGQRDINLFIDKDTNLLVKSEYRTKTPGGEQEVTQEKYFSDYKDVMGMKSPGRVYVEHDGKFFMDLAISDTKLFESLDAGMFAMP